MKIRQLTFLTLMVVFAMACNFPLFASPTQTSAVNGNALTSTVTPAFPPSPTLTPSPSASPTPSTAQLTPNSNAVNCRSGPDVVYSSLDTIKVGQNATVVGKNENGTWWYVHDPNDSNVFCWVSGSVSTTSGDLSNLPVIPLTSVIVTAVNVNYSVNFNMCGQPNSVNFTGTITTNGPAKVTFRWEVGGAVTSVLPQQTLTFKTAGTKSAPSPGALAHVDCGKYSITLHVLSPNDISAKKDFKIGP